MVCYALKVSTFEQRHCKVIRIFVKDTHDLQRISRVDFFITTENNKKRKFDFQTVTNTINRENSLWSSPLGDQTWSPKNIFSAEHCEE